MHEHECEKYTECDGRLLCVRARARFKALLRCFRRQIKMFETIILMLYAMSCVHYNMIYIIKFPLIITLHLAARE